MRILVLNAGSGSEKASLFDIVAGATTAEPANPLWQAQIDWIPHGCAARLQVEAKSGECLDEEIRPDSRPDGLAHMLRTLWEGKCAVIDSAASVDVIGHRVVHGGREYEESVVISPDVKAAIQRLSALAPLHNPAALEGIETCEELFGGVRQVAVFDTAFHTSMPDSAALYPIPWDLADQGIRRFGFHGISHGYAAKRTAQLLNRDLNSLKLITCHLGNGCSLAAIRDGRSVDTTMGFTPLEGLMMAKRSGSVDPGLLLYLMREKGMTADDVDQALNENSGLLGISGVSADMREVSRAASYGNTRAQLALSMFVHSLRRHIGAMLGSLGGLDAIVFTGGMGENSPFIRQAACLPFGFLAVEIDPERNERGTGDRDIATESSAVRALVVKSREDWAIAQECLRLAANGS